MSKTNVNYSWLKGTKCVNRAIYLTRVQPAKLNITCVCAPHIPSPPLLLPFFHPSIRPPPPFLRIFFFDQREREREIGVTLSRSDLRLARRIQPQNVDSRDRERWWCCAGGDISCSPIRNSRYPRLRLAVPRLITVLYIGIALPLRRQFHAEIHCEIIRRRGGEEREAGRERQCQYRVRRLINV